MEVYDYRQAVYDDIRAALEDMDIEVNMDNFDEIYDILWEADSVTGNASGSYTCNAYQAEEYLCHNWGLLINAIVELTDNAYETLSKGPKFCDILIRLYLLHNTLINVIEDMEVEQEDK